MVRKDGKRSGIQRRYLKYTAALLGLALLAQCAGQADEIHYRQI